MSDCYLCGKKAEFKIVDDNEGVRCGNCKLHYRVTRRAKILHFNNPGDLDREVKMKIRDHLKKIGCGDDNSDKPTMIDCNMINQTKGRVIPEKCG